jgi:uncharacterized domain 1
MLDYTATAKKIFTADRFATEAAGIIIEEARDNYARCILDPGPVHFNAGGVVMGGAIFTLADFTFAVAANTRSLEEGTPNTVTLSVQMQFLSPAKGDRLTAEAVCKKSGRTICSFEVTVTDSSGEIIALMVATGIRKNR